MSVLTLDLAPDVSTSSSATSTFRSSSTSSHLPTAAVFHAKADGCATAASSPSALRLLPTSEPSDSTSVHTRPLLVLTSTHLSLLTSVPLRASSSSPPVFSTATTASTGLLPASDAHLPSCLRATSAAAATAAATATPSAPPSPSPPACPTATSSSAFSAKPRLARMFFSGLAGVIEICTFYPMDTIGKRLMYDRSLHRAGPCGVPAYPPPRQNVSIAVRCSNSAALLVQHLRSYRQTLFLSSIDGGYRDMVASLYAGFRYAALYKVTQRTYQFGTQPLFKERLEDDGWRTLATLRWGGCLGEVIISATAGALMGVGELIFVPISVLKVRAQTHPGCFKGRSLYSICASEPTSVLWRGWSWTLARNVPGSFGLFGGHEVARQYWFTNADDNLMQNFASTFVGAVCSLLLASPFDVIKTRMQGGRFGSPESGTQILKKLLQYEGMGGLFKGIVAKLITVGPKLAYGMGCATYMSSRFVNDRH